ncbi:hypothetical protein RND71_031360 [Anisodus tanguticus]|uniref:Uncharacterized protein n=1 Tax=Anisodus tanguticus TaxID=243964 RepID=A0AAE1RAL4_9SOLA|nr:hypothetical protein RND71_031360 [Anisodus tanguticus]
MSSDSEWQTVRFLKRASRHAHPGSSPPTTNQKFQVNRREGNPSHSEPAGPREQYPIFTPPQHPPLPPTSLYNRPLFLRHLTPINMQTSPPPPNSIPIISRVLNFDKPLHILRICYLSRQFDCCYFEPIVAASSYYALQAARNEKDLESLNVSPNNSGAWTLRGSITHERKLQHFQQYSLEETIMHPITFGSCQLTMQMILRNSKRLICRNLEGLMQISSFGDLYGLMIMHQIDQIQFIRLALTLLLSYLDQRNDGTGPSKTPPPGKSRDVHTWSWSVSACVQRINATRLTPPHRPHPQGLAETEPTLQHARAAFSRLCFTTCMYAPEDDIWRGESNLRP